MAPKARTCAHCNLRLGGAKIALRDGKRYHSKCWLTLRNRAYLGTGVISRGRSAENKAPPAEMDPMRAGRVEMYARLVANGLPLFLSKEGA